MNKKIIELLEKSFGDVLKVANDYVNEVWPKERGEGQKLHDVLQKSFDSHNQALNILRQPKCKTCGDTGQVVGCETVSIPKEYDMFPCPDCQQPTVSEFTKIAKSRLPIFLPDSYEGIKSICATLTGTITEACDIIDSAEAINKELMETCERIHRAIGKGNPIEISNVCAQYVIPAIAKAKKE